jgi:hypothetical protein
VEHGPDPWQRLIAVGSILSVLVVAVGLYFGNKADRAQLDVTLKGQASDRYNEAVKQLNEPGPDKILVRVGAIYALEQLIRNSPPDQPATVEILAGFVRLNSPLPGAVKSEPTPKPAGRPGDPTVDPWLPMDIQAALNVLVRRDSWEDMRTILTPEGIANGQRRGDGLELKNAYLRGARLNGISLGMADLRRADLRDAEISDAHLAFAHLEGADLRGADFSQSSLDGASLAGADLRKTTLYETSLWQADLSGADLTDASGLTSGQLRCATADDKTKLPAGIEPPPAGASRLDSCSTKIGE